MKVALGLRKGSWTKEEDDLLRDCVRQHGEGRWHLVPSHAGLNRCRKSCRLRWLNYLKPNIKRGEFEEDEIDMIIRLHKLLGNKWSLIAGRIPGRTANDVKNYWNTRRAKQMVSEKESSKKEFKKISKVDVIRPHPRTFSKSSSWLRGKATLITCVTLQLEYNNFLPDKCTLPPPETEVAWWEGLLDDVENFDRSPTSIRITEDAPIGELLAETTKTVGQAGVEDENWDDIDIWKLLETTPQPVV